MLEIELQKDSVADSKVKVTAEKLIANASDFG